jgi:hypothetical protein
MDDRVSIDRTDLEVACYCLQWLRRMLADFASEVASARRCFSGLSDKWMSRSGYLNDNRNHYVLETILLLIDRSFPILKKYDSKLRAFVGFRSLILCGDVDELAERTAEVLSFTDEILKAEGDSIPEDRYKGVAKHVLATMAERSLESLHTREARWTEALLQCNQREAASENDEREVVDVSRPEDGLYADDRRLVWGGIPFTLTTNQAVVFKLLVDAYPSDVLDFEFEDKHIRTLRDSFRFKNADGKNEYHLVWYLIVPGSRKDSKRMLDPAKVKTDSRFISASPT